MSQPDPYAVFAPEIAEPLRQTVERETKLLIDTLTRTDDLVPVMLRFHLETEALLERLIIAKLPGGHGFLEKSGCSYHQKLELINALQIVSSGAIGALRQLNKTRNASAHSRGVAISDREIESIGRPLGNFATIRREHGTNTAKFAYMTFAQIFGDLLSAVFVAEHDELIRATRTRLSAQ